MTHSCTPDCTAGWQPGSKCHCRGCGENFTTVANFDLHRVNDSCVDPGTLRGKSGAKRGQLLLLPNSRGYWRKVGEIDRGELFRRSPVTRLSGNGHSGEVGVER